MCLLLLHLTSGFHVKKFLNTLHTIFFFSIPRCLETRRTNFCHCNIDIIMYRDHFDYNNRRDSDGRGFFLQL